MTRDQIIKVFGNWLKEVPHENNKDYYSVKRHVKCYEKDNWSSVILFAAKRENGQICFIERNTARNVTVLDQDSTDYIDISFVDDAIKDYDIKNLGLAIVQDSINHFATMLTSNNSIERYYAKYLLTIGERERNE
jgi:hypothetical protein